MFDGEFSHGHGNLSLLVFVWKAGNSILHYVMKLENRLEEFQIGLQFEIT